MVFWVCGAPFDYGDNERRFGFEAQRGMKLLIFRVKTPEYQGSSLPPESGGRVRNPSLQKHEGKRPEAFYESNFLYIYFDAILPKYSIRPLRGVPTVALSTYGLSVLYWTLAEMILTSLAFSSTSTGGRAVNQGGDCLVPRPALPL